MIRWWLAFVTLAGIAVPVVLLWWLVWRHPALSPAEVQQRMLAGSVVVVDVRDTAAYQRRHLTGAVPLADAPPAGVLVTVCDDGLESALVTAELRRLGREAYTLDGGLGNWIAASAAPGTITAGVTIHGRQEPLTHRAESTVIQWLLVLVAFAVKPLYLALSVWAIWSLRCCGSPVAIAWRRAVWCFLIGELCCAVDFFAMEDESLLIDHLHNGGMLLAVSFAAWGVLQRMALDEREARAVERAVPNLIGLLVLVAAVTLSVDPIPAWASVTTILGSSYVYHHELAAQLIELRWDPLVGMVLLVIAAIAAARGQGRNARIWCAAAAGPILFALFRVLLLKAWSDEPAWGIAWEELTELTVLSAICWWLPGWRALPESSVHRQR